LIYCNYEFAVQLEKNKVLRVGTKWGTTWPQNWGMRPPTINGGSFLNQHRSFSGGVSARCWGGGHRYGCQIDSPDILVRLNTAPPYNYYTITFKKRGGKFVAAGRAGGLCGGLGMQQYHNHIGRKFPCKTCKRGGAVGTVICKCEEWQVPKSKSLVSEYLAVTSRKDPHPERAQLAQTTAATSKLVPNKSSLSQHDSGSGSGSDEVNEDVKKCMAAFEHAKEMSALIKEYAEHAADHKKDIVAKLHEAIVDFAKDCALDTVANGNQGLEEEAKVLEQEWCGEVREIALANTQLTAICPYALKCAKAHPPQDGHHLNHCSSESR